MATREPQIAIEESVRSSLCLAIDADDLIAANRLVRSLAPYFGTVKVGPVLWASAGPKCIGNIVEMGCKVFVDLKLHDSPDVIERTTRVLASLGASYVSMHARGGVEMMQRGIEGLAAGADRAGVARPASVAVTVLTSDSSAPDHLIPARLREAMEAGCDGVVCAVRDLGHVHSIAPRMLVIAAGVSLCPHHADVASATPSDAVAGGADLLVLGDSITDAADPELATLALVGELEGRAADA